MKMQPRPGTGDTLPKSGTFEGNGDIDHHPSSELEELRDLVHSENSLPLSLSTPATPSSNLSSECHPITNGILPRTTAQRNGSSDFAGDTPCAGNLISSASYGFVEICSQDGSQSPPSPEGAALQRIDKDQLLEVIVEWEQRVASQPTLHLRLAHAYLLLNDFQQALRNYTKFGETCPHEAHDNVLSLYGQGLVYNHFESNRREDAVRCYREVLALDPQFFRINEVKLRLGIISLKAGQYYDALELFGEVYADTRACTLSPPEVLLYIGQARVRLYMLGEALKVFNDVIESPEASPKVQAIAYRQQALIYQKNPQVEGAVPSAYEKAISLFNASLTRDSSCWLTSFLKGKCHHERGQTEEAFEAYRTSIKADASFAQVWCHAGILYHQKGQPLDALAAYISAVHLEPSQHEPWYNMALLYQSIGQDRDCLQCYDNAMLHCADGIRGELRIKKEEIRSRLQVPVAPFPAPPRGTAALPSLRQAWTQLVHDRVKNLVPQPNPIQIVSPMDPSSPSLSMGYSPGSVLTPNSAPSPAPSIQPPPPQQPQPMMVVPAAAGGVDQWGRPFNPHLPPTQPRLQPRPVPPQQPIALQPPPLPQQQPVPAPQRQSIPLALLRQHHPAPPQQPMAISQHRLRPDSSQRQPIPIHTPHHQQILAPQQPISLQQQQQQQQHQQQQQQQLLLLQQQQQQLVQSQRQPILPQRRQTIPLPTPHPSPPQQPAYNGSPYPYLTPHPTPYPSPTSLPSRAAHHRSRKSNSSSSGTASQVPSPYVNEGVYQKTDFDWLGFCPQDKRPGDAPFQQLSSQAPPPVSLETMSHTSSRSVSPAGVSEQGKVSTATVSNGYHHPPVPMDSGSNGGGGGGGAGMDVGCLQMPMSPTSTLTSAYSLSP